MFVNPGFADGAHVKLASCTFEGGFGAVTTGADVFVGVAVGLGVLVLVGAADVGVTTSFNVDVSPLITAY